MKNEPIIAYNHLQEEREQDEKSHEVHESAGHSKWRFLMNPLVIIIEIAAIIAMAVFMMDEMFH